VFPSDVLEESNTDLWRIASNQCVSRRDRTLEAMRTQVTCKNLTDTGLKIEDRGPRRISLFDLLSSILNP
jgi:hypothetical protein